MRFYSQGQDRWMDPRELSVQQAYYISRSSEGQVQARDLSQNKKQQGKKPKKQNKQTKNINPQPAELRHNGVMVAALLLVQTPTQTHTHHLYCLFLNSVEAVSSRKLFFSFFLKLFQTTWVNKLDRTIHLGRIGFFFSLLYLEMAGSIKRTFLFPQGWRLPFLLGQFPECTSPASL